MVKEWGMSEALGLRTYEGNAKAYFNVNELSPNTTDQVDVEIKKILQVKEFII